MKSLILTVVTVTALFIHSSHSEDELSKLEQSAVSLIEAFNAGKAEDIASLFVPDGELVLASGELVIGRENILSHYSDVFADSDRAQAALEAGSVRFLTDDLAIEDGTVHLSYPSGGISSHFYNAVHAKQADGNWLIASIRDEKGDHALPSEKLLALEWLVGDWMIQAGEGETYISFSWSDDGPYLDAKATTVTPADSAISATMRIGWNERDDTFVSWGFDAEGGYNQSSWTEKGSGEWLLKTEGITAIGERNSATQVLARDSSGKEFSWTKRDQTIAGVLQSDRTLKVVPRPPEPGVTPEVSE